jgi:hypothetical protein
MEDGTNKIYGPLLDSFVNSAAAFEILQNSGFPDVIKSTLGFVPHDYALIPILKYTSAAGGNFPLGGGQLFIPEFQALSLTYDNVRILVNDATRCNDHSEHTCAIKSPPTNSLIFASNAQAAKILLTKTQGAGTYTSNKKVHLYETLAEIPEYMKERMKCNLPHFSKLLENLYNRSLFVKDFLNNSIVKANIDSVELQDALLINNLVPSIEKQLISTYGKKSNDMLSYYNAYINKMMSLCMALKKCCDNVLW